MTSSKQVFRDQKDQKSEALACLRSENRATVRIMQYLHVVSVNQSQVAKDYNRPVVPSSAI